MLLPCHMSEVYDCSVLRVQEKPGHVNYQSFHKQQEWVQSTHWVASSFLKIKSASFPE